ncbi:MAG: hypothetical protein LBN34_01130 [Clostridiales Family XIII bacterium]|nr:hypothetical protein [Clostridiales Family XIII bacterium]
MREIVANVIIPTNLDNPLEAHEIEAAWIIAKHYNEVVEFLRPIDGYRVKTADLVMNGVIWEVKSPIGKSKNTVEYTMRRAGKQSKYLIFDGRRAPLTDGFIEKKIVFELGKRRTIKKVVYIRKNKEVIELID